MYTTKTKFNEFINFYNKEYYSSKLMNNRSKGLWNPKRQDYLKQYNNNRVSFLSELEEIEANSFNDLVPNDFFSDKKSKNIFSNFLAELSQETSKNKKNGLLTIDCCSIIAEQKEEYEMIKRNLNKYMDYIMDKNFFLMKYYTKNINLFYLKIEDNLVKIELMKKKMNFIKKHFFLVQAKIYLKHQKIKNCKNIYNNLVKLREFKKIYLSINKKNINYKITGKNLETKSKFNKTEELIRKIERFKYYNKSLICFWFIQNLKVNQNDYKDNYEELLSKLFLTKITFDEISSIYDIFFSLNNKNKNTKEINNELLNKLIFFYKKDIFNMIKGILLSYATIDFNESMNSNKIFKLRQLQNLSFEEKKLFFAINQICITILSFCDNIYSYLNSYEYRNTKLGQILYVNRKILYNIIIKKLKKILILYTDLILNFQNESNIYLILSSISLAYAYIEKSFQIEDIPSMSNISNNNNNEINQNKKPMLAKNNNNKGHNLIKKISVNNNKIIKKAKLNLNINNTINNENNNSNTNFNQDNNILKAELNNFYMKLVFSLLKQKIKNLSIYLSKDNWKKINIHNLSEQINKRSIKIIKYKDFLILPFKNTNWDKTEIKNQITNLINFKEGKNIKINLNNLFNKKLKERNLIFTFSSFYLFQYILDIYSYSLIVPSIKTEIMKYILNIFDYYIYSTFLMFHKDKINIDEISNKIIGNKNKNINSLSYDDLLKKSKDIEYVRNYINLISFLIDCKKDFLVKVVGNEKALFTILPIVNPQILIKDKKDNNINNNNYIEKIICYECYWTIFKIIKRMIPINKSNGKNEVSNIQINKYKIILNEIKHFIYYPISIDMIKNDSYINYFINNDWQINPNNKKINNKITAYIQTMIENIKDINEKLTMFLPISLKARIRFLYIFIISMLDKLKENIYKITNINKSIINIIIQDFKIFTNNLKDIINCNDNGNEINNKSKINLFENALNSFVEFINNIFLGKDRFLNSVGKNKISWHLINSLLNMNKIITNNEKEKIKSDLKCIYIKDLQIINDILIKNE